MAKKELFRGSILSWYWSGCNVFPIDRSAPDRRALRTSLDLLNRGARLLMFVEGTRARQPGMTRAQPGVGFLVRHSGGVPVLPVALWGTERALVKGARLPQRVPLHMRFGPVFTARPAPGPRPDDQAVADDIGRHIAAILPPEYRGYYS